VPPRYPLARSAARSGDPVRPDGHWSAEARQEVEDQRDPRVRGQRLRAWKRRCDALTLQGDTLEPLGEGFRETIAADHLRDR